MPRFIPLFYTIAILSGCQTVHGERATQSTPIALAAPAASAIAGDMTGRLAEQLGPASTTVIRMDNSTSDFGLALAAALRGWGYIVATDQKAERGKKPIALTYSIDTMGGQVLAQVATPSIALGRTYNATAAGATPTSPLSIMRQN